MANLRNPESCPAIVEAQRQKFTVVLWDEKTKRGIVSDAQHCSYHVTTHNMLPECQQILYVGEDISGVLNDWRTVTGLFPEPYSHDRPNFNSKGPCPDVEGWEPKMDHSDHGLAGGIPHDGKFSHPNLYPQDKKENQK